MFRAPGRFVLWGLLLALASPAFAGDEPPPGPDEPPPADDVAGGGKVVATFDNGGHVGPIHDLLFTPDSKRLISVGSDRTVQVWDVPSRQRLRVLRPPISGDFAGGLPQAAAQAPDGKTLLVGAKPFHPGPGEPTVNPVYLLNLEDGRIVPLPGDNHECFAVAWGAGGDRAFAVQGLTVRVWTGLKNVWERPHDPAGPKPTAQFEVNKDAVLLKRVQATPDGTRLALSSDTHTNTFRIWDLAAVDRPAQVAARGKGHGPTLGLAWSGDGTTLATGHRAYKPDEKALCLWDPDGQEVQSFTARELFGQNLPPVVNVARVSFRGAKELVLFAQAIDRLVLTVDLDHRAVRVVCRVPDLDPTVWTIGALAPDGRVAALAGKPAGSRIALFPVEEKAHVHYLAGDHVGLERAGWGRDGPSIAWNAAEGDAALDLKELRLRPGVDPKSVLHAVTRRPDGWEATRVSTGKGWSVVLRRKGKEVARTQSEVAVRSFTLPAQGDVRWVAWTAAHYSLFLSDAATGKLLHRFRPAVRWVSVASSPDGKYLLALSLQHVLFVYRPDNPDPLLMVFVSGRDWVAWTKEGYYAATPGGEQLLGWTVNRGPDHVAAFYPAERFRQQLWRPDVIKLLLDKGSVAEALKAAGGGSTDVEKLLPPKAGLKILDDSALPRVKVRATAKAALAGQPVRSLRLLVDGLPLPGGQGLLDLKEGRPEAEAVWETVLGPGEHELRVLARSPDTAAPSEAVRLSVKPPETNPPKTSPRTLHLVSVGIDDYHNKDLHLNFAAGDACDIACAFTQAGRGAGSLFGKVRGTTLLDEEATRDGVLAALRDARKGVKPDDLLVIYFAGHGVKEGGDFYLLTQEADTSKVSQTALSGKELRKQLADMPCQVLLILDACHSAAGVKAFKPATDDAIRNLSDDDCPVALLCAARGDEEAGEEKGNGTFTRWLVQALQRPDVYCNPYNRRQYLHDLHKFVFEEVQRASDDRQHPYCHVPEVVPDLALRRLPQPPSAGAGPGGR
jgi:WD40 repeat protein